MTETHIRRKRELSQQQKLIEYNVNTEKQQCSANLRMTVQKMQSSIKQLQKEHIMWLILSQETELRCEDAQSEFHQQKSSCKKLVQMQVNKAIRKERELKSYILECEEFHAEWKAKHDAIKTSKYLSGIVKGSPVM